MDSIDFYDSMDSGKRRFLVESFIRRGASRGSDVRLATGVLAKPDSWPRASVHPSTWR